ncbi:MAG TPA: BspA family leucine-rich repeat surface protein [Spirochaetota bacterium]|nr:BspA family leucine-rich repeat surface protein [Spirochaetota bacterium]
MKKVSLNLFLSLCISFLVSACDDGNSSRDKAIRQDAPETPRSELFITTWDTWETDKDSSGDRQVRLPLHSSGTYDFTVEWGDGSTDHITAFDQAETLHTYPRKGEYDVTIRGTIVGFGFTYYYWNELNYRDNIKLVDVKSWGPVRFHNQGHQFSGTKNLTGFSATDAPVFEKGCYVRCFFSGATSFNGDIGFWDVSNIRGMGYMFYDAHSFNQDISGWDVSNVIRMDSMFDGATVFNQDISGWDVSNVRSMYAMFYNTISFNQDISLWDVSNVEDMSYMFSNTTAFNQDIGSWDVSSVTYMQQMFDTAQSFNQDIGGWDVGNVTDMFMMFYGAENFNRNLDQWDVSNVTDMTEMFVCSGLEGNEPVWYGE